MIFGDGEYLIVTRKAADHFRAAVGRDVAERDIRNVLLKIISEGTVEREYRLSYGLFKHVRAESISLARPVKLVLSYGERGGKPQLAPDGVKRCVYAVDFFADLPAECEARA